MASVPTPTPAPTPAPDETSETASSQPQESRAERLRRHGHRARLYAGAFSFVALLAVLVILISRNTRAVKLDWVFGSTKHASLVWIVLAAAVLGWLLGITTAVVLRRRTRRPS
jgi:uncharacterized integral membrane protein